MITYVINRSDRPQRLRDTIEELKRVDLNAKRFSAIINKRGWKGARDSHLAVMELCKDENMFMVLEDDVKFLSPPNGLIDTAMRQLPDDWDMLYLGCSPQKPQERYSDNLFRVNHAWCLHAVIWHNREGGAMEYMLNHRGDINKIDVYLSEVIHPLFNCFTIFPMVATQRVTGESDTCHRSDVSTIEINYTKYCV